MIMIITLSRVLIALAICAVVSFLGVLVSTNDKAHKAFWGFMKKISVAEEVDEMKKSEDPEVKAAMFEMFEL